MPEGPLNQDEIDAFLSGGKLPFDTLSAESTGEQAPLEQPDTGSLPTGKPMAEELPCNPPAADSEPVKRTVSGSIDDLVPESRVVIETSETSIGEVSSLKDGDTRTVPLEGRTVLLESGGRTVAAGRIVERQGRRYLEITEAPHIPSTGERYHEQRHHL